MTRALVRIVAGLGITHASSPAFAASPPPLANENVVVVGPVEETGLALDASAKEYVPKLGDTSCTFRFKVKNVSKSPIVINQVRTTCGCTIAKLPSQPWRLAPGAEGTLQLDVDLRGKSGVLIKTATIDTATSYKELTIVVRMPNIEEIKASPQNRSRNLEFAKEDRQAVFKNDCAACHAAPAVGKMGAQLYAAACGICHEAKHRATMVPDLRAVGRGREAEFWRTSIVNGKPGTLMPAFSQGDGGPLSAAQIDGLVDFLVRAYSAPPPPKSTRK